MTATQIILAVIGLVSTLSMFISGAAVGFAFKIAQRVTTSENDIKWFKDYVLKDALMEFSGRKNPTPEHIDNLIDRLIRGMMLSKEEITELAEWLSRIIRGDIESKSGGRDKLKAEAALHLLQEQYL